MSDTEAADFHVGVRGEYQWLTCGNDVYMGTIVRQCPEIVLGRCLVVTSIDSGTPSLTEAQKQAGWKSDRGAVYSIQIQSANELFYQRDGPDDPGYDEWWIFEKRVDLGDVTLRYASAGPGTPKPSGAIVFVNYPFRIDDGEPLYQGLRIFLWNQVENLRPESYIADGRDCLTFITRNPRWFELAIERLTR